MVDLGNISQNPRLVSQYKNSLDLAVCWVGIRSNNQLQTEKNI